MPFEHISGMSLIGRVRRNHALEHATIQVLTARKPHATLAGYSNFHGFYLLGNVTMEELQEAVEEALKRLKAGEKSLAIHPHCGTNYVTSGILAGTAAWLGMLGMEKSLRKKADRLPFIIALVTLALMVSSPLGPLVQSRLTTDANVGSLQVVEVMTSQRGGVTIHRITTRQ